jgi:hypothetical protein
MSEEDPRAAEAADAALAVCDNWWLPRVPASPPARRRPLTAAPDRIGWQP